MGENPAILYVNGTPQVAGQMLIDPRDINPANNYLGKSQWPDPLLNGEISGFGTYDEGERTHPFPAAFLRA